MEYYVKLLPLTQIRPSEEVNRQHVAWLADEITRCQRWTTAVPVDRHTGIIMDGNHRYQAARQLGLHCIPCVMLDYTDERVSVCQWCSGEAFCPDEIVQRILVEGALFPYKTTRHQFSPQLPAVKFELSRLSAIPGL
ncbi:transcriptional regulator [Salmonella enterica]|nr:transcriptional regulator [Salmonella enterica]EAX6581725.1 transcriptional regulator [Salmonella enterica]